MKKGITRRWLVNGFGVIALLILVIELAVSFALRSYCYRDVEKILSDHACSHAELFSQYTADATFDFEQTARDFAESFTDKERFELQIVNDDGLVLLSSTGFMPSSVDAPEYAQAIGSQKKCAVWHGATSTGENVMAVSAVIENAKGECIGAVRYVTSLTLVDRRVMTWVGIVFILGIVIMVFIMLSSSYFVSSIVGPLKEIGETARGIAMGDFDARIDKKYDDEIGDLADTINYMAGEISRGEKMKNQFISSVSHELRTPLTAITGWSETMLESGDPEIVKKGLQVISREATRLSGIVEELLDFSRLQNGNFELKTVQMDLLAELEETVLLFRERAAREGLTLDYIENIYLPPIVGDPARLKQVFINVMDNAIKYSNPGGTIHVEARLFGSIIKIIISDNGVGISQEALPHVKERFFRANAARPGSGIGLALADEIVRLHGGTLDIRSEEGIGTTVTIRLPVPKTPAADGSSAH
ncbi:MAG: HAMP domain-containing histidine kinase [Ruminococcaceae bacterium]|nr:HAMP domain-containing histidine kinase [Oscillospiraceae bacterium]